MLSIKNSPLKEYSFILLIKSNVLIGDYLRLFILLRYGYLNEVKEETISYFYKMAALTGTIWDKLISILPFSLIKCLFK